MDDAHDNLEPGALIGERYRVVRELGQGGTGAVYEVADERQGRPLALKMLHLRRAGAGNVSAAFEREYHTLVQLAHPRIIEVFDYGLQAGRAFYTMELLDGQDLQSLVGLPWAKVCALLCDVASSLAIIHSRRLVHRDVTARNVRCTGDGRAKLLDFGAMVPMGVPRHIMGTPPYIPPEALAMQSLDGRADLYSFGALAYFLLTGYHAYEARSLDDLRAIWASPPMSPGQYLDGIPPALDQLVMELLQLERSARPGSAAEVMERLSGIANLPYIDLPAVKRSYLVMPNLVGRDAEVQTIRKALDGMLTSARGGALCIEGESRVGRSRCLEACVLEARLRGILVLRGDAADSVERGDNGVIRALCEQLWQADPDACERIGQDRASTLSFVLPELPYDTQGDDFIDPDAPPPSADEEPRPLERPTPERSTLLGAVRELLCGAASSRPILVAVDDAHAIDEPSAALLGMLARVAKQQPIFVVTTADRSDARSPALAVLRDAGTSLPLAPLDAEQHEALLRSIFGDVDNVAALAAVLFELTSGSPGATMMLAEDLIERDLARYEAGYWSLPAVLRPTDLPRSVSAALLDRLAALGADARELAESLSLEDPSVFAPDQYCALAGHADSVRVFRALEELLSAGILARIGERVRFVQPALAHRVACAIPDERKRALHRRIATVLAEGPLDTRVARHRLLSGDERLAIREMRAACRDIRLVHAQELDVLIAASAAAERLELGLETRLELHTYVVQAAAAAGRREVFFEPETTQLLERCVRDFGLLDYAELPGTMEPEARAREALGRARARYDAAAEAERGLNPAVEMWLTRIYGAHSIMASAAQDLELVERLPRLDPMGAHVRAWHLAQAGVDVTGAVLGGRTTDALESGLALVRTIDAGHADDDPRYVTNLRFAVLHMIATFAATNGQAEVGSIVAEVEKFPGLRANAWRVRMVYDLMQGNLAAAADCQRRAELLHLQDSGRVQFTATTARIELLAHIYAESVLGVKQVTERLSGLVARYPGWRPTLAVARCHYRRLQGDPSGALRELEAALHIQPGRHLDWWLIAYSHIKVLCDLDRGAEAVEWGERYLRTWRDEALSSIDYGLQQVTAEALARVGRLDDARAMIDSYIRDHTTLGTHGLRLGLGYETAARIAIALGDEAAVSRYTALCAAEYKGRDLLLRAKLDRLLHEVELHSARISERAPA